MPTADVEDWTRPLTLVTGAILPGADFPDWTEAAQIVTGGGGFDIPVGGFLTAFHWNLPVIVSGGWALTTFGAFPNVFTQVSNSPAVQGDAASFPFACVAGTYSLQEVLVKASDQGIQTWSVDGTTVGTVDGYAVASGWQGGNVNGIVIAASGNHTLTMTMASKNASSSGFGTRVHVVTLQRTA